MKQFRRLSMLVPALLVLWFDTPLAPSGAPASPGRSGDVILSLLLPSLVDESHDPATGDGSRPVSPDPVQHALYAPARYANGFDDGRVTFSVRMGGHLIPYRTFAVRAMPGEAVEFSVQGEPDEVFLAKAGGGVLLQRSPRDWTWKAPDASGMQRLVVYGQQARDSIELAMFVLVPATEMKNGILNGYRIGRYPRPASADAETYTPPAGFVEVTAENFHVRLSPHFELGQFVCKQQSGFPKYLVFTEKLLLKLELILARVNEVGPRNETFVVMSGFRTPHYNGSSGNVAYSRHCWGDAADIRLVSPPVQRPAAASVEGVTGETTGADALYRTVENLHRERGYRAFVGGLGRYGQSESHRPFVHVDARGSRVRWEH